MILKILNEEDCAGVEHARPGALQLHVEVRTRQDLPQPERKLRVLRLDLAAYTANRIADHGERHVGQVLRPVSLKDVIPQHCVVKQHQRGTREERIRQALRADLVQSRCPGLATGNSLPLCILPCI